MDHITSMASCTSHCSTPRTTKMLSSPLGADLSGIVGEHLCAVVVCVRTSSIIPLAVVETDVDKVLVLARLN
eukprot:CAMPEP_0173296074 /NCGR_PEP_ID=MMETSP1143-20121109/14755_1 /TAXON_ID=483371 /ORGANISM="non described non described, Strain CCMP2298" /LENGTH=71 /DNA_ID=CAMNT_0014235879 /DNA_START=211 /DNA_END=426 /DNA_ORIENTATION=+